MAQTMESQESQRGVVAVRQTRMAAATGVWYLWVVGILALAASAYFFTHPETWTMDAEQFYVFIFAGTSFLAVLAAAYTVYSRPKLSV